LAALLLEMKVATSDYSILWGGSMRCIAVVIGFFGQALEAWLLSFTGCYDVSPSNTPFMRNPGAVPQSKPRLPELTVILHT